MPKRLWEPRFNPDAVEGYRQALYDLIHVGNLPKSNTDLVSMGARDDPIPWGHTRDIPEYVQGYKAGLLAASVTIFDDFAVSIRIAQRYLDLRRVG